MSRKPAETALVRGAGAEFEAAVGGRENLTEILATTTRNSKQDILFRLLMDPSRAGDGLTRLCQDAGIPTGEVLGMYRDAVLSRSLVEAQTTLASKLQGIVQDVASKAQDRTEDCECVWISNVGEPDPDCELCRGTGRVFREGSLKHAEVVFKATGLQKDGGGVNVSVQQNVGLNVGGGLLDSFVKATDEAAFDILEGETVETPES